MSLCEPAARLVIRGMRPEDLPVVLAIEQQSFPRPWSRAFFEKELTTPFARLVVAVDAAGPRGRVIGYSCSWRVADEVHLLNVAVHPDYRGLGHGREIVTATIDDAVRRGARVVYLEVRAGNLIARRLYRRLGFRELGLRRGYYGPGQDGIVMELRLDAR